MHKIISPQNEKIKRLKKLQNKKYRQRLAEFTVENFKIIKDAFNSSFEPKCLFITEDFFSKNKVFVQKIENKEIEIFIISQKINKIFSSLDTASGVCAVYEFLNVGKPPAQADGNENKNEKNYIYLNKISDPGNLGTILRSALAFGFKNIILDENCVDLYNYKVINAAKDAIFKLNFQFDQKLKIFKKLKKEYQVLVTSLSEKAQSLQKVKIKKDFVLVFGNESNGVELKVEKLADKLLKIEMSDEIESLNVATSAAIILHKFKKDS